MNEKRYLGIDWGEKRIGLAIGDDVTKLAVPCGVVGSLEEVLSFVDEEDVNFIVVGKPLMLSGSEKFSNDYEIFIDNLKRKANIEIFFIDERLTSRASDALHGDKKNKAERDAISAMLILQDFFDRMS